MNRPVTPESVLSNDDPGDDTQRRFRYQATYAAIISLSLLEENSNTDCIFCEHHEDVLIKQKDGTFVGIQIKTRLDSKSPYKAGDEPVINSLKRFIKLDSQFPGCFSQYVIAANNGFWQEQETKNNLPYLLKLAKAAIDDGITPHQCFLTFVKKLSFENEDIKLFNADGTVSDVASRVLSKVITQEEDLPKLEYPERDLIEELAKLPDMSQRGYDGLKKLAEALVNEMFRAASLANNSSQPLYFYLLNDSAEQKTKAIIQGKQITREKILKIIQEHSSTQILDIGKAEEEAQQEQAIEKQAIAYRQKLISGLCNLQIFKMSSPLNLEDVYVKLQVRQEEKLPSAKEEERVSLAGGEPTELLRLFQGRLAEQAATAMSPEEALSRFKKITVLGEPGAGKTTILRHLAVKMANGALPNLPDLPVYVELRSFVESGMEDLLDFVVSNCAKPYNFPDRSYLEKKLNDGEAALLLDGLDEVLVGKRPEEAKKAYNRLAKIATDLAIEFSNAPIAVTCRRAGWQGLREGGFQTLEVLDFDESQIQEFLNNWFKSDQSKAKGLLQELEKNLRMKTLAANPLILSLMAIVYERELELPERRSELYQHCVEVLLQEWDSEPNRGIQRLNQFTPTQMQNLLIEVAWYFHLQGKGYFREAELLGQLPSFLSNSDINIPLQENKAILEEITGSSSLLKEAAYKLYGFLHLTFQEYFAALAAKKKGSIGWQEVVAHRHEPWWEEVILLVAECMDDATPLLLGILGHPLGQLLPGDINQLVPGGKPLAVNDDLFHSDLLLAARCLVGKPQIQMQGLRDRIIAEVKHLCRTLHYGFDCRREIRVLVEIGGQACVDELLNMLADNDIHSVRRFEILLALRELGDRHVAQPMLALLERGTQLDENIRWHIVDTLTEWKATFAVSCLLAMLKAEKSQPLQEKIVQALGKLGDKSLAPCLKAILSDRECNREVISRLILAESIWNGESPLLLKKLLDESISLVVKLEIVKFLKDVADASLSNLILEWLQNETIDWHIRWLLTEVLESLRESTSTPLMEMLEEPSIDERVRVGIAATLGTWGVWKTVPFLCKAIKDRVVPPSLNIPGYGIGGGYVWTRIAHILMRLSDYSVVPSLVEALISNEPSNIFGDISAPLGKFKSEAASYQVLAMLNEQTSKGNSSHEQVIIGALLMVLPEVITKPLANKLLDLLAKRKKYNISEWHRILMINAIAQVVDNQAHKIELIKILIEMIPKTLNEEKDYFSADSIRRSLYLVSLRAKVRLSTDGHLEEIKH